MDATATRARRIEWPLSLSSWRAKRARQPPAIRSVLIAEKGLMQNPEFSTAFKTAKARIRNMDFRFVEETDQNSQALLEIYCTLALNARFNDFNTH